MRSATTTNQEARRRQLLDTIRTWGGRWTSGRVQELRRQCGHAPCRTTARRDLHALAARGHLEERGPQNGRFYTLCTTRKDDRS
ncbi:hypothetical protein OG411_19155 [Streptomyces pseudogriseolus]|uniref:hypothetical protein n=1 Tax=Streptomyces pseudogriseolus TaxID=36817 RepID=UPI00324DCBBC